MIKCLLICFSLFAPAGDQVQSPAKLITQGDELLRSGKALKAVGFYNQAIASGALADGYSSRAKAWYKLDRMDRFILDVEKALDMDKTHAYAHFQRAQYAMRSRDWSLAKTSCDRSIKNGIEGKQRAEVLICRGEAYEQLGNREAAIDDLKAGLEQVNDDPEASRLLASLYNEIELHSASAEVLIGLLNTNYGSVNDRVNLGYQLAQQGMHDQALKEYEKALLIERNNPIALSNYAYSLYKLGRNEDAELIVKKSLRAVPGNPYALRTRGMLRLAKGDKKKACQDLCIAKRTNKFKELNRIISTNCGSCAGR